MPTPPGSSISSRTEISSRTDLELLREGWDFEAKKAAGFEKNNMTPFANMPDFRIKGIIAFMKTLAN